MKKMNNKRGFTLAELLIVVAIIAVLVAVSIPIFTSQLEKAREATDEANIRALYAETVAAVLSGNKTASTTINGATLSVSESAGAYSGTATYTLQQAKADLESGADVNIAGINLAHASFGNGKTVTITVKDDGSAPTIVIAS